MGIMAASLTAKHMRSARDLFGTHCAPLFPPHAPLALACLAPARGFPRLGPAPAQLLPSSNVGPFFASPHPTLSAFDPSFLAPVR